MQVAGTGLLGAGVCIFSICCRDRMRDFFLNSGLCIKRTKKKPLLPKLVKRIKEEHGELLIYTIPSGLSLEQFENKKEAMEHHIQGACELWAVGNLLHIKAMKQKIPQKIYYNRALVRHEVRKTVLGVSLGHGHGGYYVNDLAEAGCHMLVGGTTNSGKSVFLRQALMGMIDAYHHEDLRINLIDMKRGAELGLFEHAEHIENFAETPQEAGIIFAELNKEADRRAVQLRRKGKTNISQVEGGWPRILTVVDEFADITDEGALNDIERLLRYARFSGIHIILSTQRPEVKQIPGSIKANLPASVAFRTKNIYDSRTILDNQLAAYLPPFPGRGIFQLSKDKEFQVPYLTETKVQQYIRPRVSETIEGELL